MVEDPLDPLEEAEPEHGFFLTEQESEALLEESESSDVDQAWTPLEAEGWDVSILNLSDPEQVETFLGLAIKREKLLTKRGVREQTLRSLKIKNETLEIENERLRNELDHQKWTSEQVRGERAFARKFAYAIFVIVLLFVFAMIALQAFGVAELSSEILAALIALSVGEAVGLIKIFYDAFNS